MKALAQEIYDQYFRAAQSIPRGVVAKLSSIVTQLESASEKHCLQVMCILDYLFWDILALTFEMVLKYDITLQESCDTVSPFKIW